MTLFRWVLPATVCAVAGSAVSSSSQMPDPPKVRVRMISKAIAPGALVKAEVDIGFAPGLHGYQNPPGRDNEIPVSVKEALGSPTIKATYPLGHEIDFAGGKSLVYEGTITVPITFRAPKKLGPAAFSIVVTAQQCDSSNCYPPTNTTVKSTYSVVKPGIAHRSTGR